MMIRTVGSGHILFALGTAGTAVLSLIYGDFALQWQPFPDWIPGRAALAYASGVVVLAASVGVFFRRTAVTCALVLSVYQLIWVLTRGAGVIPAPASVGSWLSVCESLTATIGGWILLASLVRRTGSPDFSFLASARAMRTARILFGLCCLVFGLSHFTYASFTADMIPRWLPERLWLAYLTGAGHMAAGLALVLAIAARLAATLEALMLSSFVVLVHIPSIGASPALDWAPTPRVQWTALSIACTLAGAAWLISASLREQKIRGAP